MSRLKTTSCEKVTEISAKVRKRERRAIYSDIYNADRGRGNEQASKLIGSGSHQWAKKRLKFASAFTEAILFLSRSWGGP